jgi:antirestriction protein ArdC
MSAAVYQKINESIERLLDSGLTFSMPFKTLNGANAQNLISKTPYTGRNAFLMGMAARFYGSPYFVSFKQAQELGGTVKKGEKSWPVVFFAMLEKKGQENVPTVDRDKIPLARWSNVFNIRQCEGIEEPKIESISVLDFSPIEKCESIAASMPNMPKIEHVSGSGAFYVPSADKVQMPMKDAFRSNEDYYATLFHELAHSTGHASRLERETLTKCAAFGSAVYSREELVAEFSAAYLCGVAGIENKTVESSAAYITGWKKKLKDDPTAVFWAMKQAELAADYIQGIKKEGAA